jgi:hypothetical protein
MIFRQRIDPSASNILNFLFFNDHSSYLDDISSVIKSAKNTWETGVDNKSVHFFRVWMERNGGQGEIRTRGLIVANDAI